MKNKIKYRNITLGNGARLTTISGIATKAVTIAAYLRAGFRFDPQDKPGLSHFTEHMVFSGTKSFPSYQKEAEIIERHGGWHMAYTWIEEQRHFIHLPKDYFKDGLKVMLESIYAPLTKKEEVEKEKGTVKEEILKNKSDPAMAIWDHVWFPLFFQSTHLARPYSGSIESIQKFSTKDVKDFISNNFVPEGTVLLVAGDLDEDYVKDCVRRELNNLLSDTLSHRKTSLFPLQPKRKKKAIVYNDPSYYKSSIMVGVETVSFTSHEKFTINIIRELLCGYFGSNLVRNLRDEGGLIYSWQVFHDTVSDTGYLVFNASTAHENVYKVIKIVLNEFHRLSIGNILKDEIEIAKGHMIGSIRANIEKGQDYIEWYGIQELLDADSVKSTEEKIDIYQNTTLSEVKKVSSKYLRKENILIGVIGRADEKRLARLLS